MIPSESEVRHHIIRYYAPWLRDGRIDQDDIAQEVLCRMLEGASSLNSAVQVAMRREIIHNNREVPTDNLDRMW